MINPKYFWIKLKLRYKIAFVIGIISTILSLYFFIKKDSIFGLLIWLILVIALIYCGGFELSRGILPEVLCDNYFEIALILITIFSITFIFGIVVGLIFEVIFRLIPYLRNPNIKRNFIFVVVSLIIMALILIFILKLNQ